MDVQHNQDVQRDTVCATQLEGVQWDSGCAMEDGWMCNTTRMCNGTLGCATEFGCATKRVCNGGWM